MSFANWKKRQRKLIPRADAWIWVPVVTLMTLGTVLVLSASAILAADKYSAAGFFWMRQVVWWVAAVVALYICSRLNYRRLGRFAPILLLLAFIGLIAVLWADPIRGARRWLVIGGHVIQPSELFRLAYLFFLAFSLARRQHKVRSPGYLLTYVAVLVAASGLLLAQPSFSTVLCLWATTIFVLWVAGTQKRYTIGLGGAAIATAVIVVYGFGYKKARMDNYVSMLANPTEGCYQVRQAAIAMGAGGVTGRGLGSGWGKMHYVPDPHTDFIFASIVEEVGLLGSLAILMLYLIVIWRGFMAAARAPDRLGFFLAGAVTASLAVHVGMNVGVVMGLLPTTGLPLPLLSYGGSSLFFTAVGIGLVLSVSREGNRV